LIGKGAAGYSLFILTEGSAVVTSQDTTLAALWPGDFFGEIAIRDGGRRSATVTIPPLGNAEIRRSVHREVQWAELVSARTMPAASRSACLRLGSDEANRRPPRGVMIVMFGRPDRPMRSSLGPM
jgi:hypothetical protein